MAAKNNLIWSPYADDYVASTMWEKQLKENLFGIEDIDTKEDFKYCDQDTKNHCLKVIEDKKNDPGSMNKTQLEAELKVEKSHRLEAEEKVEKLEKEAETAKKEAEEAKKEAETAKKEAEEAKKEAETAKKEAEEAKKEAEAAKVTAVKDSISLDPKPVATDSHGSIYVFCNKKGEKTPVCLDEALARWLLSVFPNTFNNDDFSYCRGINLGRVVAQSDRVAEFK